MRELKMRSFISSAFTDPIWGYYLPNFINARTSIYEKLELKEPTASEKKEALQELGGRSFPLSHSEIDHDAVETFGNLMHLVSIIEKLRSRSAIDPEDRAVLTAAFPEWGGSVDSISDALITKFVGDDNQTLHPLLAGSAFLEALHDRPVHYFRHAARQAYERATVMEFSSGSRSCFPCVECESGARSSSLSAMIVPDRGQKPIYLDAVFHTSSETSSYLLSTVDSVFTLAAYAGWITSHRDIPRVLAVADLLLASEHVRVAKRRNGSASYPSVSAAVAVLRDCTLTVTSVGSVICTVFRNGRIQREFTSTFASIGGDLSDLPSETILLDDRDVVMLGAASISAAICQHEMPSIIAENGFDVEKAEEAMVTGLRSGLVKRVCADCGPDVFDPSSTSVPARFDTPPLRLYNFPRK
ncbi:hypothetical protein HZC07_00455 [Candidatus Micrarchaeota archaeon]|nr:hypothetical protein [Candidatus Micrarchaeota archaeon]